MWDDMGFLIYTRIHVMLTISLKYVTYVLVTRVWVKYLLNFVSTICRSKATDRREWKSIDLVNTFATDNS